MSQLKVTVKKLPISSDKKIVDLQIEKYSRSGRSIKTEIKDNLIMLYYIEEMD